MRHFNPYKIEIRQLRCKMGLNAKLKAKALSEFKKFKSHKRVKKDDIIVVLDYTLRSNNKRLFVVDVASGKVLRSHHAAHGVGSSDPRDRGKAITFSNRNMSKCSSVGAVATAGTYYGKYGRSLNLIGLEKGLNNNMLMRRVVLHKSNYVTDHYIARTGRCGQSWGCPAVDPAIKDSLIDLIKGGTFCYFNGVKHDKIR